MSKKNYIIVFVLLLQSCFFIEEDMSDCPEEIRVFFDITQSDAINPNDIDRMHLYVFNDKGGFLREYIDDNVVFSSDYYIDCSNLTPGKCRFVAWGGKNANYYSVTPMFVKGETTLDEALLTLKSAGGIVSAPMSHLFHSCLPVTVDRRREQKIVMPLIQFSNTIHIRVKGASNTDLLTVGIVDNNSVYHFNGDFAPASSLTYTAPFALTGSDFNTSLTVLRMAEGRNTMLQLYNVGELIFSHNLINLILARYPGNNFDTKNVYHIEVILEGPPANLSITINIDKWEEENNDYELF